MSAHAIDIDSCESSATYVLRNSLTIEEYLLGLAVRLELVALTLLTSILILSSKHLSSKIHLNCWIPLQLREYVLHIVHDIG